MKSIFDPFNPIGPFTSPRNDLDQEELIDAPRDLLDLIPTRPLIWPFQLALIGLLLTLMVRLVSLQVVHGASNQHQAQGNRIRPESVEASRGLIVDAAGRSLATNDARFSLQLTPANLPRGAVERTKLFDQLAPLAHRSAEQLKQLVDQAGQRSVERLTLLADVDHDAALALMLNTAHQPGVRVVAQPVRRYVTDGALSHVLGYLSSITPEQVLAHPNYLLTSQLGQTGVEASYDQQLRGQPGIESVEVNASGDVQRSTLTTAPTPGSTVELGLNLEVQKVVAAALQSSLDENHAAAGAAIGLDPRDGTVRFLVSLPAYDGNLFSHPLSDAAYKTLTNDKNLPLLNRVIAGEYPPGSTIKPVIASGGLANGVITKDTTIDAPAEITVGNFVFPDWKRHGIITVERAIAVSSDVFFYAVGGGWNTISGLGISRLDNTLSQFGIGKATHIDLPGEQSGLLPTPEWRKKLTGQGWYIGDTYHLSIGQGDLVLTPLQLALTIEAVANGGTLWQPHVAAATIDPTTGRSTAIEPKALATGVEATDVLKIVQAGMRQTVTDGSGRLLNTLSLPIAGKTGTAEFGTPDAQGHLPTHAWFASYAPADRPQLVMVILAEGGGEGNVASVPVAKSIYQYLIDHHFFDGDGQWTQRSQP